MNRFGSKKTRMYASIRRHGEHLHKIFPKSRARDPIALSKTLHMLEGRAHRAAEQYANGQLDESRFDAIAKQVLANVDKVLGFRDQHVPVFVNSDPRGYALKINDGYVQKHGLVIERDWGGYGILAPEFTGER